MPRILRNETIERQAEGRLAELTRSLGGSLPLPIPIDRLAEDVLGLDFLWEGIEELPGETILGGLDVDGRQVILNERHVDLFTQKPGLERSTKGHELGHWDLFVNRAMLGEAPLPGLGPGSADLIRRASGHNVAILAAHLRDPRFVDLAYNLIQRHDTPDEARAVNRYAAAIAMPRDQIRDEAARIDVTRWRDRYDLAAKFGVTISALGVRLDQLGLSWVEDKRRIHRSKAEAAGQLRLAGLDQSGCFEV
jgi:hypothetical protein